MVARRALLLECALVFLVNHDQAKPFESYAFLNQRVRANACINFARSKRLMQTLLVGCFQRSDQQLDSIRGLRENAFEVASVLLGENLCRYHQRRLISVLHRDHHCDQRDDRFAAADIALQ